MNLRHLSREFKAVAELEASKEGSGVSAELVDEQLSHWRVKLSRFDPPLQNVLISSHFDFTVNYKKSKNIFDSICLNYRAIRSTFYRKRCGERLSYSHSSPALYRCVDFLGSGNPYYIMNY